MSAFFLCQIGGIAAMICAYFVVYTFAPRPLFAVTLGFLAGWVPLGLIYAFLK